MTSVLIYFNKSETSFYQQPIICQYPENDNSKFDKKLQLIHQNLEHLKDFLNVRFDELEKPITNNATGRKQSDLVFNARVGSVERIR